MRWPPWDPSRSPAERRHAEEQVTFALDSLSIILHDLRTTLGRIEDKRQRGLPSDEQVPHDC